MQHQKMLRASPKWPSWNPNNAPPKKWESPGIRFWRDVLKRPLPPTPDDDHSVVKWAPMTQGIYDDGLKRYTATVLEYEAQLLNELNHSPVSDEFQQFDNYIKENEMEWFRVDGRIYDRFLEAIAEQAKSPPPSFAGSFLKFYFPAIRRHCEKDNLTKITEAIFED